MEDIYQSFFTDAERLLMASLPAGWLMEVHSVSFRYQGQRHYEQFDGTMAGLQFPFLKVIAKTVFNNKKFNHVVPYSNDFELKDKALINSHERLNSDRQEFKEKVTRASQQLNAVLQRYKSCHVLAEAWPELVPFLPKEGEVKQEAPTLPALPLASLNEMFGLPV